MIGQDLSQNIGQKSGYVHVPYSLGNNTIMDHLNTNYFHVHGKPFVYPNHADDIILTSGTGIWGLTGAIIEIIPANTLTVSDFDLHWVNIADISAVSTIQIDFYKGAEGSEILIGGTRANRTTSQNKNAPNRIQIPQQVLGERISARLSDSTSGSVTCLVSFEGHYYSIGD
jgi:hypothetical protein